MLRDDFARMHDEYLDPDRHSSRSDDTEGAYGEIDVDLKWSLWSADKGHWRDYAPSALKMLEVMNDSTLIIHTAPRKEIRFGKVTITGSAEVAGSKGKLIAVGYFIAAWDDVPALMDTLGIEELHDEEDAFRESLPFYDYGEVGIKIEFKVKARSVQQLLTKIDKEEEKLLALDKKLWKEIEEMYQRQP